MSAIPTAEYREGKHVGVWPEDLGRRVGAPIIIYRQRVVAREFLEDLPNAPQDEAYRLRLVIRRNADVEHYAKTNSNAERIASGVIVPLTIRDGPRPCGAKRGSLVMFG